MKEFDADELCQIAYGDYDGVEIVNTTEEGHGRWTCHMTTIFKYEDKLYALEWEQGLTEYQEDEFYWQPYEVREVKKMIEITTYVSVEEG